MNARLMGMLSLLLMATLPVVTPAAAAPLEAQAPLISASGTASLSRAPDVARVSFAVETNADTETVATQQNAAISARVRSAVERLGIHAAAIITQYYTLRYNPRPEPTPPPVPMRRPAATPVISGDRYGYVVTNTLEVTSTPARIGSIIDAAVGAGATSVGGISYDLSNRHSAYLEAVRLAVADAKSQAQAAAAASGAHLGAVHRIFVGGERPVEPLQTPVMRAMAAPVPTEITPGEVRIFATVTLEYELAR